MWERLFVSAVFLLLTGGMLKRCLSGQWDKVQEI